MAKYRRGRINDELTKEVAEILRGVKDPRVGKAFVTITASDVSPDLKYAKVYYSFLNGEAGEVAKGLKAATGFIRREVATRMNLRITPELTFVKDESVAYGAHIANLINNLTFAEEDESASQEGEENKQ